MTARKSPKTSSIVDQFGRPQSSFLYSSPLRNVRHNRPRAWLSPDTKYNVSAGDRAELVNYSRQLVSQVDVLNAAVHAKNDWAFGDAWDAHYTGANKEWGVAVQSWLNEQWMPNCNVRGPTYDLKTSLCISGLSWDVDGDDVMVLTESVTGFPQLAFFPGTKIGNPYQYTSFGGGSIVKGGLYDGAKYFDGVIYDRNNRPLAVRIVGEDGQSTDISSYNCDLAYEPKWCDQGRGIPRIATSLLRWMNLQDIDEFIQRGVKRAASVGLLKKNAEGEAPPGSEAVGDDVEGDTLPRGVQLQEIEGGEMYYLSAPDGEEIMGLNYQNPHPNTEEFIKRVTRGGLASVGWYAELLDLSQTGRAPSRILCDLANRSIGSRQTTGWKRWKRAITYAVGKGMKNGLIPKNNDGADPYRWEPGYPKPVSVDAGNEANADREALKMGLTTRSIVSQKMHGAHYLAVDDQREKELRETFERARYMAKDFPEMNFDRCLELLEQRNPNPMAQQFMSPQSQDRNAQ